jgi:hypothetical protein
MVKNRFPAVVSLDCKDTKRLGKWRNTEGVSFPQKSKSDLLVRSRFLIISFN